MGEWLEPYTLPRIGLPPAALTRTKHRRRPVAGLTLPGLCSSMGACSLEQLSAVVDVPMPSTEQR